MNILITCPPMLGMIDEFRKDFADAGATIHAADVVQTLSVEELSRLLPDFDGWIAGDDPANREVLQQGSRGKLRALVKWGVGVDNVDFEACREFNIDVTNTPGMFGHEVADIATGYVIGLARQTFLIDREIRDGKWPKPAGVSLYGRRAAVIGYGDIGRNIVKRLLAMGMSATVYDPAVSAVDFDAAQLTDWPTGLDECDFIVIACALNESTKHLIDRDVLRRARTGVRIVNVSRGPVVDESALIEALDSGKVDSAALDVFEIEPLPAASPIRLHPRCILGSHNASNTVDAVRRTSFAAMDALFGFLVAS